MKMRILRVLAAFTAAVCMMCGTLTYALPDVGEDPPHVSPVGLDISDLTAEDLWGNMTQGELFSPYELTLMVVWVTWSGASDACMNVTEQQHESLLSQNINCLGVYYESEQHPVSTGRKYYEEQGYSIYSITNRKAPVLDRLFSQTESDLPVVYVVDGHGYVKGFMSGYLTHFEITAFLKRFKSNSNIVTFIDGTDNSVIYQTVVTDGGYTYYPNVPEHNGYVFKYWNKPIVHITSDMEVIAVYDRIGDVNFDRGINTGDAALILRYCAGGISFSEYTRKIADFNNSGEVNTGDAADILKFCAYGMIDG